MLHVVSGPNSCIIGPCQSITYDSHIERLYSLAFSLLLKDSKATKLTFLAQEGIASLVPTICYHLL